SLGMIEHMIFERHHSRLVMQAFERIGAIFDLSLREQEVKAARLLQANVEAGFDSQCFGELGPSIRRLTRPKRVSGHTATLTLHPDQGKIPARGPKGDIALIKHRHAAAAPCQSPGDRRAHQTAADDGEIAFIVWDAGHASVLAGIPGAGRIVDEWLK